MLVIANNGEFTRPEKIIIYREIIKLITGKPLRIKGLREKIGKIIDNFRSRPGESKRERFLNENYSRLGFKVSLIINYFYSIPSRTLIPPRFQIIYSIIFSEL